MFNLVIIILKVVSALQHNVICHVDTSVVLVQVISMCLVHDHFKKKIPKRTIPHSCLDRGLI